MAMMYTTAFHTGSLAEYAFLVTGGAGFIGSHLVEYLVTHQAGKVRILDDFSTGFEANVKPFLPLPQVELVRGSITDPAICAQACQGIDFVLHQAALGSVPRSVADPATTNSVNITGFLNMLVAAHSAQVKRLVFAGSSSVYGDHPALPKSEAHIGTPLSPYAVTKRTNELYAQAFARCYQMEIIGLRYFNIFGPRQNPQGPYAAVIPLFLRACQQGNPPIIFGDGQQSRDFTFVANAVQGNIKALFAPQTACGQMFNIACGERTSLNDLLSIIGNITQKPLQAIYQAERNGDIPHSLANIEAARQQLGYSPTHQVDEGLALTWRWFKKEMVES